MIKIAISQRLIENPSCNEIREALDTRWGSFLAQAGLLQIAVPTETTDCELFFDACEIAGLLLTGGNDLSICTDTPLSRLRDTLEKKLLAAAIKRKLPVMGICRGAQLIADFWGATFSLVDGHVSTRHPLKTLQQSRTYPDLKRLTSVNSFHNFAIKELPQDLIAIATSPDNSIEAIEHLSLPICGLMWHPEREDPFNSKDLIFFKEFFRCAQ